MVQRIDKQFVLKFIKDHGIGVKTINGEMVRRTSDGTGEELFLEHCPFNENHDDGNPKFLFWNGGKNAEYVCHHESCKRKKNKTALFIKKYDPHFFQDAKLSISQSGTSPTADEEFPDVVVFSLDNIPPLRPALIHGVLREGHKALLAGPSKAGKSFALIELALAVATGTEWLGLTCEKRSVLYLNLEIDSSSFLNRVSTACKRLNLTNEDIGGRLRIWNLRKEARPLGELIERINSRAEGCGMVILDPIYKVLEGDENSASDMAAFTRCLDKIAEGGAAVVYAHHYGKATQNMYRDPMSRASGSGVFARDPDAMLSMSALDMLMITDEMRVDAGASRDATAFQLDFTLREFPQRKPVKVWFDDCQHWLDSGALDGVCVNGKPASKGEKTARIIAVLALAYEEYKGQADSDGGISLKVLDGHVDSADGRSQKVGAKTIRSYASDSLGEYFVKNGKLYQREEELPFEDKANESKQQ